MSYRAILYKQSEIQTRVRSLAIQMSYQHTDAPIVVICVLRGAFMFFTDLVRNMQIDVEIDFMQTKSYVGLTQTDVAILKDIEVDIKGKTVYLVDDILDSGNTMKTLLNMLKHREAKRIIPVTLLKKQSRTIDDLIYGFEINDAVWLHGYGLDDEDGHSRNLENIYYHEIEID